MDMPMGTWMTTLLESRDEAIGSIVMTAPPASIDPHRPHRCPRCGHVEHTDSELPGTCVVCPGVVALEPA
jgi:hypothetical protein